MYMQINVIEFSGNRDNQMSDTFRVKKVHKPRVRTISVLMAIFMAVFSLSACGDDGISEALSTINNSENSGYVKPSVDEKTSDETTTVEPVTTPEPTTTQEEATPESTTQEEATPESTTPEATTPQPTTTPEATTPRPTTTQPTTPQPTTTPEPETTPPIDYVINIKEPSASGTAVSDMNGYIIDYSNINNGYVMVKMNVSATAVVQVRMDNSKGTLIGQYMLKQSSNYVAIPLTKGAATYCVRILQQNPATGGYVEANAITQYASIASQTEPYTYPNVYVYYTKTSTAVDLSYQLCAGKTGDDAKVKAMYDYIVNNISYDYDFAKTATAGYMDAERCLRNGKGICGDYSVLFATMCRAQGIPCIVIEGYVTTSKQEYHAWNQVYYNGSWHFYDTTFDAGGGKGSNYLESYRY